MFNNEYASDSWTQEEVRFQGDQLPFLHEALYSWFEKEWHDRESELIAIRALPDDWDGEGSESPAPELVDRAISFLAFLRTQRNFPPPSRIVTSPTGSVVFEWQQPGMYLEAEMAKPDYIEWVIEKSGQASEHWVENLPLSCLEPECALSYVSEKYYTA